MISRSDDNKMPYICIQAWYPSPQVIRYYEFINKVDTPSEIAWIFRRGASTGEFQIFDLWGKALRVLLVFDVKASGRTIDKKAAWDIAARYVKLKKAEQTDYVDMGIVVDHER